MSGQFRIVWLILGDKKKVFTLSDIERSNAGLNQQLPGKQYDWMTNSSGFIPRPARMQDPLQPTPAVNKGKGKAVDLEPVIDKGKGKATDLEPAKQDNNRDRNRERRPEKKKMRFENPGIPLRPKTNPRYGDYPSLLGTSCLVFGRWTRMHVPNPT